MWNQYQLSAEKDKATRWLNNLDLAEKFKSYIQKAVDNNNDVNWIAGLRNLSIEDIKSWLSFL